MSADVLIDLPGWLDASMTLLWLLLAMVHGVLVVRIGSTAERWLRLVGWSILAVSWIYRLAVFGNVSVSAPSVLAVLLIAGASVIGAQRQLREWSADIRCYRDNHLKCHRADRVDAAMKKRR